MNGITTKKFINFQLIKSYSMGVLLFISIVSFSVLLTFNLNFLYRVSSKYISISNTENLTRFEIMENYDYIIDYITSFKDDNFNIPTLQSSTEGSIHFSEVREIYWVILTIFVASSLIIVSLHIIQYFLKINNDYFFVKVSYKLLIFCSILITIPSMVLFGNSFDWMHMLIFNNDYWLLNSGTDPIINYLPESYFFICLSFIFVIIILNIIILRLIYKHFTKQGEDIDEND